ncbi:hypothetical protein GUITHDRAFT_147139 [Guillardia theta CCMP2712]|uniref:Uncharacterized protein n=1 Tax=Guillardia theta (strain CCMP2712) TaxID=905079 RepID=L1IF94_GUITC|nr:hypothetical protein GUITHDRAFT_147139 [Guillardia theta CCMP2712]EKX34525.1 hypothetical protein GUITHDRAFT_147139 [Guillardia theta CCMP2712]|eukprot:XP_005821505.1 hypothetical protein GUITHDRAFT_147139 [Guillardia theta CCMP2712]
MEHGFSYVGYDPTSDKAIIQFGNEANARLVPAHDLLKTSGQGESNHCHTSFSYVGYDPKSDKAIVQYSDESSARLVPAVDVVSCGEFPQLETARRSAGFM